MYCFPLKLSDDQETMILGRDHWKNYFSRSWRYFFRACPHEFVFDFDQDQLDQVETRMHEITSFLNDALMGSCVIELLHQSAMRMHRNSESVSLRVRFHLREDASLFRLSQV